MQIPSFPQAWLPHVAVQSIARDRKTVVTGGVHDSALWPNLLGLNLGDKRMAVAPQLASLAHRPCKKNITKQTFVLRPLDIQTIVCMITPGLFDVNYKQ